MGKNFQIKLETDFPSGGSLPTCVRCGTVISFTEDAEYVSLNPVGSYLPWNLHTDCMTEILSGMLEFYKVFIINETKKTSRAN